MILAIYLITVLIYFLTMRMILSKGLVFDFKNVFQVILIIFLGFVPGANICFSIIMICDSGVYSHFPIDGDKFLRKILFVKDKRDERWH